MKKTLIIAVSVMFLAAGCNKASTPYDNSGANTNPQSASQVKIDSAVDSLNSSVAGEETVNLQSDNDVISSETTTINSYQGAVNENSY